MTKKISMKDFMRSKKISNYKKIKDNLFHIQFNCGHEKKSSLNEIKQKDFKCLLCGDNKPKEKQTKKEICKNSRFTVGFNEDSLGSMVISPAAIKILNTRIGLYQAIYNNPKNNPIISHKLINFLTFTNVFNAELYGENPRGLFFQQLDMEGHNDFLKEYEKEKIRIKVQNNNDYKNSFVLPNIIKEKGAQALRKLSQNNNSNIRNN